jgi:hypothetical protein
MMINFSDYDLTEFNIKEDTFCGIPHCKLITPKEIGCKWTQKNKIFRSSIWTEDGYLISASWPKFTNFGENPENFPPPKSLNGCDIVSKIDGTTLIVDYVNCQLSMRTRGTFNYATQENANDFRYILERYPQIARMARDFYNCTLLFELTTPNNVIVIRYGDTPDIKLIGMINKIDYSLTSQSDLDFIAKDWSLPRAPRLKADDLSSLISFISTSKGIEGACLYSDNGQSIHKIKSEDYLIKHRLKSEVSSFWKLTDLWMSLGRPNKDGLLTHLATLFDWELAQIAAPHGAELEVIGAQIDSTLIEMKTFTEGLKSQGLSKKEAALQILAKFKERSLDSFAFSMYNNKEIDNKAILRMVEIFKIKE